MSTRTVAQKLLVKPDTTMWSSDVDRLGPVDALPGRVDTVDNPDAATTATAWPIVAELTGGR